MAARYIYEVTLLVGASYRVVAANKNAAIAEVRDSLRPEYRKGLTAQRLFPTPVKTGTPRVVKPIGDKGGV